MQQDYKIFPPPDIIKNHVKYFWTLNVCIPVNHNASFRSYVDDSLGMSFQLHCNHSSLMHNDSLIPVGMMHGLNTVPSVVYYKNSFSAFGLVFYPHAINEIFGIDAYHFTNKQISIEDEIDSFLTEQILGAQNTSERINIITSYLVKKIYDTNQAGSLTRSIVSYIREASGLITVKDLVLQLNINERKLERVFKEQIGVSARHYIKTARFQQALQLISDSYNKSLTEIAYKLQYADQSHFIRHVRELSGLTPKELRKQYHKSAVNIII